MIDDAVCNFLTPTFTTWNKVLPLSYHSLSKIRQSQKIRMLHLASRRIAHRARSFTTKRLYSSSRAGERGSTLRTPTLAFAAAGVVLTAGGGLPLINNYRREDEEVCRCDYPPEQRQHNLSTSKESKKFHLKQHYEIEKVLGEGTYGMVYQAKRKSDGALVALKTMPREYTGKTDFEREVAALQSLSEKDANRHVVRLYDLHRDDENYYLALELIQGGELFDHLIQHGPYSEALASQFLRQFAEALCFIHNSGYTHADLKPENLMLATSASTNTEILKLVDFGCATTHDLAQHDMMLPAQEFALGCSFLHTVALGNQFEMQRILMQRPNLVNFRDYDKRTALHIAASEGHLDICRFLVERGARINRVDRWNGSPLDDAHRHGHKEVLDFLGKRGAKFGNAAAVIEKFISAASQGDVEEVEALLKFGNLDINQGDYDKRTALHLAAGEGRTGIVELLCQFGADVNVEDRWGNKPMDDARRSNKNSDAVIEVLQKYGASSSGVTTKLSNLFSRPTGLKDSDKSFDLTSMKSTGTIAYWSPELLVQGAEPTPASDMWAAGVIVYIILTGIHPFDKNADATDEQIAETLAQIRDTAKVKDGEEQVDLVHRLAFDDRVAGLSDSVIELMKRLLDPNPEKRMTASEFRKHPWTQGITASWSRMTNGFKNLEVSFWQNKFREEVLKKFGKGGTLSDQELERMFHSLDLKNSGVLDVDEFLITFRELGIPDENIRHIFQCADLDGSGVIRFDEFRALMGPKIVKTEEDGDDELGLHDHYLRNRFKDHIMHRFGKLKLREIFNAIDLERNGVLDPHEIRVVLRSAGEPEDVISRIVASLDVNRDGGVDWSEFKKIMGETEIE